MGIRWPLSPTYCTDPTVASSGPFALWKSTMASPSADCTCGLLVSKPFGVCTGSLALNGFLNGEGIAAEARSQNRRNSSAPRDPRFSLPSHFASTPHAPPTATGGPDVVGA